MDAERLTINCDFRNYGRLAQLVRASPLQGEGRGFESLSAYQTYSIKHYKKWREIDMGTCGCGFTTDPEKNCNGTHRVVQAVKADIAEKLTVAGFADASDFVKNEKKS